MAELCAFFSGGYPGVDIVLGDLGHCKLLGHFLLKCHRFHRFTLNSGSICHALDPRCSLGEVTPLPLCSLSRRVAAIICLFTIRDQRIGDFAIVIATCSIRLLRVLIVLDVKVFHTQQTSVPLDATSAGHGSRLARLALLSLLCNILLNHLLRIHHKLQRELVRTKAIIIPATDAIRDSERTINQKVGVLALIRQLSYPACTLDQDEGGVRCLVILIIVILLFAILVKEGDFGDGSVFVELVVIGAFA